MSDEMTAFDPYAAVVGSTVGPWLILERMDSGSFGIVYRARRAGCPDSPPVVVKMARHPKDARFEREVELLQHNPHPSIPRFEDAGLWTAPDGQRYPYVVMELVEGFTLYDWFRAKQRTSRDVLRVLAQVAGALAAAHARGAVHRDVKGDNIRVTSEGRAVLVDWGSGWFAGARPLTDTTAPPGTSAYRPPEQRFFAWTFRKDVEARWQAQPEEELSDTDRATSTTGSTSTEEKRRPRRELLLPPLLSVVIAAAVGGLLVFLGWEMHRTASQQQAAPQPWSAPPEEVAHFAPDAGVGEEALSVVQDMPRNMQPSMMALGRPMPSKPFPGQKKPPCDPEYEIAALGVCWAVFKKEPPCGSGAYDFDGLCIRPVIPAPSQPTSDEP